MATQIKTADPDVRDRFVREFGRLVAHCAGVRVPGCRVLMCHVADGRFTAHVERGLDAWDLAAGSLILAEAGGTLTDFDGRPVEFGDTNDIVATNGPIHTELINACIRWRGAHRHPGRACRGRCRGTTWVVVIPAASRTVGGGPSAIPVAR